MLGSTVFVIRAPLRVSLAGGGSDLEPYAEKYGGEVVSFAINKYVYLAFHETFYPGIRLAYSRTESVSNYKQISHPLFRNTFGFFDYNGDIEIGSFADIPSSGSGLGSSSAFTVALVTGFYKILGREFKKSSIAENACHIEINLCGDPIGKQDQFASSYGGLNHFIFHRNKSVSRVELDSHSQEFMRIRKSLLIYHLGAGRSASQILMEQNLNLQRSSKHENMTTFLKSQVAPMVSALNKGDINSVGELLHEGWLVKREMSKSITNPEIDRYYELARGLGAIGGKVLGAGGGGCILFCVPLESVELFRDRFPLREIPFDLDDNGVREVSVGKD